MNNDANIVFKYLELVENFASFGLKLSASQGNFELSNDENKTFTSDLNELDFVFRTLLNLELVKKANG